MGFWVLTSDLIRPYPVKEGLKDFFAHGKCGKNGWKSDKASFMDFDFIRLFRLFRGLKRFSGFLLGDIDGLVFW